MWVLLAIILLLIMFIIKNHQEDKINQLIEYPRRKANITFFWNGKKLFDQYLKDIQNAKQYVCITFFIVQKDELSQRFFRVLKEASDRGVDVYLLIDRLGSRHIDQKQIKELNDTGVHFCFSNKLRLVGLFHTLNYRNHRKITVIDGETAYIGGYNVADEYVNDSIKFAGWRDYHLRLEGEIAIDVLDLFIKDWERNSHDKMTIPLRNNHLGSSLCQLVPTKHGALEEVMMNLIQKAEKSIYIGTPYFIPSEKLMNLLLKKAEQGVEIKVLYPHEADHPFVKEASIPYLKRIRDAGSEVMLFTNGFYHAKIVIIDDQIVDIGTANFDRRSLFINDEVNLFVYDEDFIEYVKSYYLKDIKEAMPLYDDWMNHPNKVVMTIKRFFANLIKPLL